MSKKVVIIIGVIILVLAIGGGTLLFLFKNSGGILPNLGIKSLSKENLGTPVGSTSVVNTNIYNDDSGFSFNYPTVFTVTDITPNDDNSYYSLLEIKKDADVIKISIKDGNYSVPGGAVAVVTPSATSASVSATLKLGDFKSKQYTYDDNGMMKTLTLASSQGVSYAIDGVTGNDDEKAIYNSIVASFILGKKISAPVTNSGGTSDTVDEGSEVVQ